MLDGPGDDTFRSVLGAQALRVKVSDSYTFCGQWEESEPAVDHGVFHWVDQGVCRVHMPGLCKPEVLMPGDLVMFPHGAAHTLSGDPHCSTATMEHTDTVLLCCDFHFASGHRNPLLAALPEYIVVRESHGGERFRKLAQLVSQELRCKGFGGKAVLDKLADTMFTMALRHYVQHAVDPRGLIAAFADTRLARALSAMHADPGRDWTVASLAAVALQSRTAFAQRFVEVMETSPYQYLVDWRMSQAERLLADRASSVSSVAEQLGYRTEAAFRRAFKRINGYGPGQVRRAARTVGNREPSTSSQSREAVL